MAKQKCKKRRLWHPNLTMAWTGAISTAIDKERMP